MRTLDSNSDKSRHNVALRVGLGVLFIGLIVSAGVTWMTDRAARRTDAARFQRLAAEAKTEITRRMRIHEHGLYGARGLWPASKSVERGECEAMVKSHNLPVEFPGTMGMGFIKRVERPGLEKFLAATRADDAPNFQVRTSGDAPDLYVVEFIEPLAANRAAEGFDIGSDPICRAAADRAMLTGQAALTPPITLAQAEGKGPGFLYLLPVYRKSMPADSPEERRTALEGWVYMPLVAAQVFNGVADAVNNELDIDVYQGGSEQVGNLIYDSGKFSGQEDAREESRGNRSFQQPGTLAVGGQPWTLFFSTTPKFTIASRSGVWATGAVGALLAFLAAGIVWSLSRTAEEAKKMAHSMTADLRESEQSLRDLVNQIGTAATGMEVASQQQATGAVSQATAIAEMSATASELLASARQMTENGTGASEQAELAAKECADGTRNIQEAVQSIAGIRERVETIAQHMLGLSSKSQQISGVLDIINELSEQTNLLSLNASIEAAGAGDAGKRFAVVASEIRKLAERAAESTREIRGLIEGIQSTVNTTIMATEEGTKAAQEGVRQTGELEGSFARIASQVAAAAQSAKAIEMASRQQARAIEQVDEAMRSIDAAATQSEATAQQVQTEARALVEAARRAHTDRQDATAAVSLSSREAGGLSR